MKIFVNFLLLFLFIELQLNVFCAKNLVRPDSEFGHRVKGDKLVKKGLIRMLPEKPVLGIFEVKVFGKIYVNLRKVKLQLMKIY